METELFFPKLIGPKLIFKKGRRIFNHKHLFKNNFNREIFIVSTLKQILEVNRHIKFHSKKICT